MLFSSLLFNAERKTRKKRREMEKILINKNMPVSVVVVVAVVVVAVVVVREVLGSAVYVMDSASARG